MNKNSHRSPDAPSWQWPVLCGFGLLALGLGLWGFLLPPPGHGEVMDLPDAFYHSLELFRTHFSYPSHPLPWELQVARFLAPLVVGFAVLKAFVSVAHWHRRALLHQIKRRHVVICGLGRKGLQLAKKFRDQKNWVVVIEKDPNNELLQECESEKILCWIGDASQLSQLKRARVHRARLLIAATGDDGKNVEIALRAAELCNEQRSGRHQPPHCFVHVVDPQLRNLFRKHRIFTETGERFRITMFDFYESCALMLFQEHALDGAAGIHPGSSTFARLVVMGFGQMGESVFLQAARIGHFASGKQLRVTVIDSQAERLKQAFYRRYPNFDETCEIKFLNAEDDSPAAARLIEELRTEQNTVLTIAVCYDDDTRAMTAALNLKSQLKDRPATILVRMSSTSGLTALLSGEEIRRAPSAPPTATRLVDGIKPFGMLEQVCAPGHVLHEELDYLAMKIHGNFVEQEKEKSKQAGKPPRTDAGVQPWAKLEEDYKNSNRQQALHLQIKLRAISCRAYDPDNKSAPAKIQNEEEVIAVFADGKEIDLLAEMEHARWCADKWLSGWEPGGPRKDDLARKHPDLIPWSKLDPLTKDKDRNSVKLIPQIVTVLRRKLQPSTDPNEIGKT